MAVTVQPLDEHVVNDAPALERREVPKDVDTFQKFDDMPGWKIAFILVSLGMCIFMFALEETSVATSVATIGSSLQISQSLTWISTTYLLALTCIQPITGRLSDAFGTKRLLFVSLWIFVLGNIIAGTAHSLGPMIAGRLICGIGGAGLFSLSCIVISLLTYERQRSNYMNLINIVFLFCDAVGPTVGGALAKSGNWRWIFLLNAPFGPVITIILWKALRIPQVQFKPSVLLRGAQDLDMGGITLLIAFLSMLIVALNVGGQSSPWDSPLVIGMFVGSGVSFVLFVIVEDRWAKNPIAPMQLFKRWKWRNVPLMTVTRTMLFFHCFANTFYLPVLLQVSGTNEVISAALVIPFLIIAGVASVIANAVAHKYGHVRPVLLGSYIVLPVGMGLMSTLTDKSSLGQVVGYSLISGASFGTGTQLTLVIGQVGLDADILPTVTALLGTAPTLGGVLGVGIIGTIINNHFQHLARPLLPSSMEDINLNDVVTAITRISLERPELRDSVVEAYVQSWKLGCWVLAGIAGLQFFLCLLLKPVHFDVEEPVEGDPVA